MTFWYNIHWNELQEKAPVDLRNIISLARDIENKIRIKLNNIEKSKENILLARARFDVIIRLLLSLLRDKKILEKETDKILFVMFQENFARILKRLDEIEENRILNLAKNVDIGNLTVYAEEIESILYGDLYFPLLKASEEAKNPREFFYVLFEIISLNVGVFGGITREKRTGIKLTSGLGTQSYVPTYKELLSPEGQKKIEEKGENALKDWLESKTSESIEDED